jgi:enoyl-CoA hydratase/carnithine racemase
VGSEPAIAGTADSAADAAEPELITSETGPIAWITLNRPTRKNALTVPMREGFCEPFVTSTSERTSGA